MNCRICEPLLSAYVDGEMPADERAAVGAHLHGCPRCRSLAEDLSSIRVAAASLEPLVPPARVWNRISAATMGGTQRRGVHFSWWSWRPIGALAMTAVMAASLWRVGVLLQPWSETDTTLSSGEMAAEPGPDAEAEYSVAIARLEEVTNADRDVLDQDTAGALHAGLTVIDEAITESRAALRSEPQSESAQESLVAAQRRKVALLQETLALINEMKAQDGTDGTPSEVNR